MLILIQEVHKVVFFFIVANTEYVFPQVGEGVLGPEIRLDVIRPGNFGDGFCRKNNLIVAGIILELFYFLNRDAVCHIHDNVQVIPVDAHFSSVPIVSCAFLVFVMVEMNGDCRKMAGSFQLPKRIAVRAFHEAELLFQIIIQVKTELDKILGRHEAINGRGSELLLQPMIDAASDTIGAENGEIAVGKLPDKMSIDHFLDIQEKGAVFPIIDDSSLQRHNNSFGKLPLVFQWLLYKNPEKK